MAPTQPLFFEPNRVWRCYTGGALLDAAVGRGPSEDAHFPEYWLASCVRAVNGEHSQGPEEGLSRVRTGDGSSGPLFRDVLASDPAGFLGRAAHMTLLCKYLDSAVRLPIQCHPDRDFARVHYKSDHGKVESWIILGTRAINGVEPYLLMGFKPGISEAAFARAVHEQDISALEAMLHRVPVRPGDVYFIPGRFPHAIGPGVFLLEVQEPSDWVVQPERFCADQCLSDADMWGPLDPVTALSCFRYEGATREQVQARLQKKPVVLHTDDGGSLARIIGPESTECFGVDRLQVTGRYHLEHPAPYSVVVVTQGAGTISWAGGEAHTQHGDVFFVPFGVRGIEFTARTAPLEAYLCLPSSDTETQP